MAWCIAMLCSPGLYAQEKVLGLEEMFHLADEQSRSMRVYELGMLAAEEGGKGGKSCPFAGSRGVGVCELLGRREVVEPGFRAGDAGRYAAFRE